MDRIKKIKVKKSDGTFTDYLPLGSDAEYIDLENGNNLQEEINHITKSYDNVAAMKADETLKAGDICQTLGYYEANDGGAAKYKITSVVDDTYFQESLLNEKYANLIIEKINSPKQFGAKGDGTTDDTNPLQQAINYSNYLIFNPGIYMITTADNDDIWTKPGLGIWIESKDDFTIDFNGSTLKAIPNEYRRYNMLTLWNAHNIVIKNGILQADRHLEQSEFGHALCIRAKTQHVKVENIQIFDALGDGVSIDLGSGYSTNTASNSERIEYITLSNCYINNCRRQGITLGGGVQHIKILDTEISNTHGVDPQSGIDIETGYPQYQIQNDILIEGCLFRNNFKIAIVIANQPDYLGEKNIYIKNCDFIQTLYNSNTVSIQSGYAEIIGCKNVLFGGRDSIVNIYNSQLAAATVVRGTFYFYNCIIKNESITEGDAYLISDEAYMGDTWMKAEFNHCNIVQTKENSIIFFNGSSKKEVIFRNCSIKNTVLTSSRPQLFWITGNTYFYNTYFNVGLNNGAQRLWIIGYGNTNFIDCYYEQFKDVTSCLYAGRNVTNSPLNFINCTIIDRYLTFSETETGTVQNCNLKVNTLIIPENITQNNNINMLDIPYVDVYNE